MTGNNREERKRSEPFGDRAPVAGLQGIRTTHSTIMPLPGTSSPKNALYSWGVTAGHKNCLLNLRVCMNELARRAL